MSHAITALLLLQLDRVPGEWVKVEHMAYHLSIPRPVVCDHLLPLAVSGQVWLTRDSTGLIQAAKAPPGDCDHGHDQGPDQGPAEKRGQETFSGHQATTPRKSELGRTGSGLRPAEQPNHALIHHP